MTPLPQSLPGTPPRARSDEPSPLPRNSMADADDSVKRKRPRLDSGDRAHRSMSTDPSLPANASSEPAHLHHTPEANTGEEDIDSIPHPTAISSPQALDGTPSKVTINVRASSLAPSPKRTSNTTTPFDPSSMSQDTSPTLAQMKLSDEPQASLELVAVASPSSRGSPPVIEVAEPEDMDGHTGPTVWHTRIGVAEPEVHDIDILVAEFQRIIGNGNCIKGIEELGYRLQNQDITEPILSQLSEWIDKFLHVTRHRSLEWFDICATHRELWDLIPVILEHLSSRRLNASADFNFLHSDGINGINEGPGPLQKFLLSYATLMARMINTDNQTLKDTANDTSVTPDLMSTNYIRTFRAAVIPQSAFMRTQRSYDWPIENILSSVFITFISQLNGGINSLTDQFLLLLGRTSWDPEAAYSVIDLIKCLMAIFTGVMSNNKLPSFEPGLQSSEVEKSILKFFVSVDEKLQEMVCKQSSTLNLESLKWVIEGLTSVLQHCVQNFKSLDLTEIMPSYDTGTFGFVLADKVMIVVSYWKMHLLKKCIIQGRMDSRALGVEMMSDSLVEVFNKYLKSREIDVSHPIPQFNADFIQQHKLVEYLLGVESHTQLVGRSKNVIGFLIVSQRYSEKETDIIWNSVLTSQDPRLAEAILQTATGILDLFTDHDSLNYWFLKLSNLSCSHLESPQMRLFSRQLGSCLLKYCPEVEMDNGRPTYHLLYSRIIREIYVDQSLSPEKKREILAFAIDQFKSFLSTLTQLDLESLYKDCVEEIAQRSPYVSGCITILNILLEQTAQQRKRDANLQALESDFSFTSEVVGEFSRIESAVSLSKVNIHEFNEILTERLKLVQKLILGLPEFLNAELTRMLWSCLVGDRALDDSCRDIAWQFLSRAIEFCQGRTNPFFEQLLDEHFAKLDSIYFTSSVFQFVNAATDYGQLCSRQLEPSRHNQRDIGELFWPLALKATSPELGSKAIENLVETQLKSQEDLSLTSAEIMDSHAGFVARAIQHLTASSSELQRLADGTSSGEDDAMVIVATEKELAAAKLRFVRSLAILHRFVQRTRSHRSFSPDQSAKSPGSLKPVSGAEMTIKYQPHLGGKPSGIRILRISDLATFEDLLDNLKVATGFENFNIFTQGQKLDQNDNRRLALRDMSAFERPGLLVVQKQPGTKTGGMHRRLWGFNRVEAEVMKHFHVLYNLLSLDDELSEDVYRFLSIFPPHDDIASLVYDTSKDAATVFPSHSVYKAMYSVHALRSVLDEQLSEGAAPPEILCRAVHVLVAALTEFNPPGQNSISKTETVLALAYVDALLKVLRERVSMDVSVNYFNQPNETMIKLRSIIDAALNDVSNQHAVLLVNTSFLVMLEASTHSEQAWASLKVQSSSQSLLQTVLLECPAQEIRSATRTSLMSFLTALSSFYNFDQYTVEGFFWSLLSSLIPYAVQLGQKSEQFFMCAHELFMALCNSVSSELQLPSYVRQWSELLIHHPHVEFVGRRSIDYVVYGLATLLDWCIKLLLSQKKPLDLPENLANNISHRLLFPEISHNAHTITLDDTVAVLDSKTRSYLYGILLASSNDLSSYAKVLETANSLTPEADNSNAWAWGFAQITEESLYSNPWEIERQCNVRSETGYAGLKNLQNTCYMNSLLTQLFMNINFRKFLLKVRVSDPENSQKLLFETQKLLSYMQETWLRAVDPDNVSDVLVTFEGTPIDVSIQMDVDEFYNLLFHRWENQMLSGEEKKIFRSFYGGEIVQQIKSRDCPHVSERFDSFSAIQCDIQGKINLAESLGAYVEGEMMEGDNKYSCSTCGTYVNAVKRNCFKTVPDNLIFHLKRFDYDLMTGTRSKINERFEFPQEIDMAPYHVDHLQGLGRPSKPDMFTLVGVLVHSGSAEAGHYYSYVRERPCNLNTWLEFNDSDVTYYNPINLESNCFGGWQEQYHYSAMAFPKTWNAYMLFYQRTSVLEAEKEAHMNTSTVRPFKVGIPSGMETRIGLDNREFIRMYCLFDPEHARFAKMLVEKYFHLSKDGCSENHELEKALFEFGLEQTVRIFSRQKECKELRHLMDLIAKLAIRCPDCSICFITWVINHAQEFKLLILRCPVESVRQQIGTTLVQSLQCLRLHDPDRYGIPSGSPSSEVNSGSPLKTGAIFQVARLLRDLLQFMPSHSRAWDEFFGIVAQIAAIGPLESMVFHDKGFLGWCLEILVVSRHRNILKLVPQHQTFVKNLDRRTFSFNQLTCLLDTLLEKAEIEPYSEHGEPLEDTLSYRNVLYTLTDSEIDFLTYREPRMHATIAFLEEILLSGPDNPTACTNIVRTLVHMFPKGYYHDALIRTVARMKKLPTQCSLRPFIWAALAYCGCCQVTSQASEVFMHYLRCTDYDNHGPEYFEFFRSCFNLRNDTLGPSFFKIMAFQSISNFGPTLLLSREPKVRKGMLAFINAVCYPDDDSIGNGFDIESCNHEGSKVAHSCLSHVESIVNRQDTINVQRIVETEHFLRSYVANHLSGGEDEDPMADVSRTRERIENALESLEALAMSSPEEIGSNLEFGSEEEFTDNSNANELS